VTRILLADQYEDRRLRYQREEGGCGADGGGGIYLTTERALKRRLFVL